MTETTVDDPADAAAGFAALMNEAAEQAAPADEAPYGWTTDPDGTRRPKKTPGRPRKQPTLDELKAEKAEQAAAGKPADRAPSARTRRQKGSLRGQETPGKPDKPVVQFREGVIAKGVNKLYRRTGKMIRALDRDIGQALIDITRKDTLEDGTPDPEDVTVGEAWEEIARTNPRIRGFLMKIIAGGAWGQLFMCHAPVLLAVLMKDAIRRYIPFEKLLTAFLDDSEDGEAPADGTPLEGMTMPDMRQMMAMAQQLAEQAMTTQPRAAGGTPRPPVPGPAVTAGGPAASGS